MLLFHFTSSALVSSVVSTQLVLSSVLISILVIGIPLDTIEVIMWVSSFSALLSKYVMLIDIDSTLKVFILLFAMQTAMLSGFILYCDDP